MADKKEFYSKLAVQLEDTTKFPADYMYKFIVPTDANQVHEVEALFNNTGAIITTKKSTKGTYCSLSIVVKLKNAAEVISYYKKVENIKGIISL